HRHHFFFSTPRPPPPSPLFPYTTLFRSVCTHYYANGKRYPDELRSRVDAALAEIGRITGKRFGDPDNPLLVSVRSGARASMPGRSEEHTSELQSRENLVCRLLLEKKKLK